MDKGKPRQPIQVWSPLIFKSIFDDDTRRDFSRAEKFYTDDDIIWLSPEATEISKWEEDIDGQKINHMLVPAETINKITVYNIDRYGNIYPPIANLNELKPSFYLDWLKSETKVEEKQPIKIPFPKASKPGEYHEEIEIRPIISYKKIHDSKNLFPKKIIKKSISLETEDLLYFLKDKKMSNHMVIWPEPFNHFFQDGGGIDLIYYHTLMQKYLGYKHPHVLNLSKNLVNAFLTDGESTIEKSWYNPKNSKPEDGLIMNIEKELRLNLVKYNTMKEVYSLEIFKNKIKEYIDIKRAYSWLGYFWWEFYKDLPGFKTTKYCKNCGTIIYNCRKNREFCNDKENPKCFKSRGAFRQKKFSNKKRRLST